MLGAGLTGAAIAAARVLEDGGIPEQCARVRRGPRSPKALVSMARDGLFDDVDACLHWHPWSFACVMNMRLAVNTIRIAFRGRTAHAGMQPWSGRSALDGLELAAHAINLMREHVEPTARTHYIYEAGGEAPNVVPDYARMLLLVRDVDRAWSPRPNGFARSRRGPPSRRRRRRRSTSSSACTTSCPTHRWPRGCRSISHVGAPEWTDEEQAFARECQANMDLPQHGSRAT